MLSQKEKFPVLSGKNTRNQEACLIMHFHKMKIIILEKGINMLSLCIFKYKNLLEIQIVLFSVVTLPSFVSIFSEAIIHFFSFWKKKKEEKKLSFWKHPSFPEHDNYISLVSEQLTNFGAYLHNLICKFYTHQINQILKDFLNVFISVALPPIVKWQ